MSGTGSMALGNWDAGEGNCVTQRWVRSRLLLHVPPRDQAVTLVTIAARADIDPRACRDHLRCMSSQVGTLERANRKTRYYRRTENDMPQKHDPRPLPERIAKVLPDPPAGLTARAIGLKVSCRTNTVSTALNGMIEAGKVERSGAGRRGRPYIYSTEIRTPPSERTAVAVPADKIPTQVETDAELRIALERERSDQKMIDDPFGANAARRAADGMDFESEPGFMADAYGIVIRDVQHRAREADHERRMLDQVATLLGRIVDGEADR
ncbi:hypothetical protein LCGC14_1696980 [marine sediment metagenome]|uniref:Uncharacterized protein n=1 Tax=marine sediment metagenome TaxID=412755 RepID=A0A0F9KJ47_9ZZZZ